MLSEEQILHRLSSLDGWEYEDDVITKEFAFGDFREALEFVNEVGDLAEEADHHPDIKIFDYKYVEISLTTHSQGGVTEVDFSLANQIEELL